MLVSGGSSAVLHLHWIIIFVHFLTILYILLIYTFCISTQTKFSYSRVSYYLKLHSTPHNEQKKLMFTAQ